ncbi:probable ubiquitin carboxyl-terminal hydrolase creB isoform X2 [Perca fluviatilis]|uniref:probable ubiquitin carboxyl-terminal hydrolase creB isoform X2 n=1 Tax=Perca fluviatilis TaxID=8168 RepID=UPI0019665DF8|nr:probable ubiquitin carboxyl-terminal hydrolase creB isoform X2 [Perca fluviatilis]
MNYLENGVKLIYKMMPSPANRYHGLLNQGATCYLNSVLQVLFMTEDFREAVERHTCEHPGTECIDPHLKSLFCDLKDHMAHTYTITKKLSITNVYEQRDAAEYYEKILGLTSPDASKIFHGLLTHKTICSACHTETDTDGAFWHLSLALVDYSEHYSVVNGIEEYFRASDFSGENQMYCDKCDAKSDATIKCLIKHHPEVLMLLLKRFEFDYRYMTYVKINRTVDIPYTLQIPENQEYELYAVVEHFGDLRSGHYTATIKSQEDDRWYNFSDATVTLMDYQPFQLDDFEKSSSAYLLFYRKKKVHPADTCSQDIREVPTTPGGFSPSTCDIYYHGQDAAEREEYEKAAEAGNNTAVAVSIDRNEETGIKDLVSVPERSRELVVSSDLYIEDQDVNARPSIPYNHQECNEERNDLSYRPQGAHAERPRDEKTVMDDEDKSGNAEAKEQAVKRETQLEVSVTDQENDSGRLDDVRHKRPHECLEDDDISNTSCNHQKYKQEVSSMHERREYPHHVDMQRDEERMVMDVNKDRDGKMEGEQSERRETDSTKYIDKDEEHQVDEGLDDVRKGTSERLQHSGQDVEDQNNDVRQNRSEWVTRTTQKYVGAAKQQEKKGDNGHFQRREDSSLRRPGLVASSSQGDAQTKARTGYNEGAIKGSGSKQSKTYDVMIIEEEFKDGVQRSCEIKNMRIETLAGTSQDGMKSRVEYNDGNVKRKSDTKTDAKVSFLEGVHDLKLNDSPELKQPTRRNKGQSDAADQAGIKHATKERGEKKRKWTLRFSPYKQRTKEKKKRTKTTGCFPFSCKSRKIGDQTSESD